MVIKKRKKMWFRKIEKKDKIEIKAILGKINKKKGEREEIRNNN